MVKKENKERNGPGYFNAMTSLENRKSDSSIIASYSSFPILDGVGNRKQAVVNEPLAPVVNPESTDYAYNGKKNRLETAGDDSFIYDLEGQISVGYSASYTYDSEHRLVSANSNQYSYDGKGNRLKAMRGGVTTYYVYDMNGNVLAEADGSKVITKLYIQGQGLLAMVTPSDQVYSYHFNAIGSTAAMTDQNQNVVNKYAYDAFGFVLNQVDTVPQPFKYVGQYGVMAESCELNAGCFLYMRARYYDPKVGRFISEDPIGFEGGTVNIFEYANDNPIMFSDPAGTLSGVIPGTHYCGFGANRPLDIPSADCVDEACRQHDICYKNADVKVYPPYPPSGGRVECDRKLCKDILKCKDKTCLRIGIATVFYCSFLGK